VIDHIVKGAQTRELGARGLRAALVPFLEEAAYAHFGSPDAHTVELVMKDGRITVVHA
jgi:ATP-dependent Clp protease ATP-binding subunit ClpX